MINENPSELLGFACHYLNADRTEAAIDTPFRFQDGDPLPVYVEQKGSKLRFFDDGGVLEHLSSLGVRLDEWGDAKFVEDLARPSGATLNGNGELEVWAEADQAPSAFARYISALFAIVRWEEEQQAIAEERWRQEKIADAGTHTAISA